MIGPGEVFKNSTERNSGSSKKKPAPPPPENARQTNIQQHKSSNTLESSKYRLDAQGSLGGSVKPTLQTTPLQHQALNTSTPSNSMPTSIDMSNTSEPIYSQANLTLSTNPQQPPEHTIDLINWTSEQNMITPVPMDNAPVQSGSAKLTIQMNPLQHPFLNTSNSSNPMPTPITTGYNPVHSQPGSMDGPANPLQHPAQANLTIPANQDQPPEHAEDLINPMPAPICSSNNSVQSHLDSLCGPANSTMQTNPVQYPVQNICTSSNFMSTPTDTSKPPVPSCSDPLDGHENLTMPTNPQKPPSYEHHRAPIVAIGNPGSGKSTILNALAGRLLFGSGISLGCGLTNQLDVKESNGRKFMDTPGLADETYNQVAAEALKKVFHRGGRMKVLFFITQESGRIVSQDVTTMKLVLESVPEIGKNYGVIVNKIPENVRIQLSKGETYLKLLLSLYAGIKDEFKHGDNVLLLPLNAKLSNIDNAILNPYDIHPDLLNFINTKVTEVYITPGKITEIRVDDFEQLNKQVENLQSELKKNQERQTAETEKLLNELENRGKEKAKEREEELMKKKKNIKDKKKKIKDLDQKSENKKIQEEINKLKQDIEKLQQEAEEQRNAKNDNYNTAWNLIPVLKKAHQKGAALGAHLAHTLQGGAQSEGQ